MQMVLIELHPAEEVLAEAGAMLYMEDGIEMSNLGPGWRRERTGEDLVFASLTGPGKTYLRTLPFSRFAGRIADLILPSFSLSNGIQKL